jgi:hypothetical protein
MVCFIGSRRRKKFLGSPFNWLLWAPRRTRCKGVARPREGHGGMTNMQDLLLAFQQEFGLALE